MKPSYITINGSLVPSDQAMVSVFDHGFLFGDSLYEVLRTYDGKMACWKAHYERLLQSARLCHFEIHQTEEEIKSAVTKAISRFLADFPKNEAYARIIVTRGIGSIGFSKSDLETSSQLIVIVQACPTWDDETFQQGTKLQVVDRIRNSPEALSPAIKSGNYLNNLLAVLEANESGFDDAILCNAQGHITEGSRMNLFYARRGRVATAPFEIGILDGVSRKITLELLKENEIPCRITRFTKEHLYHADEVFVTSSIKEVFPVTQIDANTIGSGQAGPITRLLKKEFSKKAKLKE